MDMDMDAIEFLFLQLTFVLQTSYMARYSSQP
jgi:hypothetical protein